MRKISMVERAVIAAKWRSNIIDGQIHALIGDDSDKMVDTAGRVFFVVIGAALECGLNEDDPDIRIIRGAINAVYDQAEVSTIDPVRRASIHSGLQASRRLISDRLTHRALTNAACNLEQSLRCGHIHMSDFSIVIDRLANENRSTNIPA